jgi:hypothetical protein
MMQQRRAPLGAISLKNAQGGVQRLSSINVGVQAIRLPSEGIGELGCNLMMLCDTLRSY